MFIVPGPKCDCESEMQVARRDEVAGMRADLVMRAAAPNKPRTVCTAATAVGSPATHDLTAFAIWAVGGPFPEEQTTKLA